LTARRPRPSIDAGSDADVPKMTSSATQVQWYRKWLGLNPWVLCQSKDGRIKMRFWVEGDGARERIEELAPDDIDGAANPIWSFIFPNADAT